MESKLNNQRLRRAFILTMCALFALFLTLLLSGNVMGQSTVFYLSGEDFQADALNTEVYARELNPYGYSETETHVPFKDANYPPLAYLLFYLMDTVSGRDAETARAAAVSVALSALCLAGLITVCYCMLDAPRPGRIGFALALLLSGVSLNAVERGNIILLAAGLCAFFLAGYRSARPVVRELAFVALAVAAALKIFPALFGLLLLFERRWKDALRLLLYGVVAAFLPFVFMKGGFGNLPLLLENFGAHKAFYDRLTYPRYGFRLFSSLAYDLCWANPWLERNVWKLGEKLLLATPWADLLFTALCLVYALLAGDLWRKAAAIAFVLINYPVNSGAYTALYLFPVIALYLSCGALRKRDLWYAACFLLILSPVQLPLPYDLLGITQGVMVSLSDILRNLVVYGLFLVFAAKGAVAGVRFLRGRGQSDSRPSVTSV